MGRPARPFLLVAFFSAAPIPIDFVKGNPMVARSFGTFILVLGNFGPGSRDDEHWSVIGWNPVKVMFVITYCNCNCTYYYKMFLLQDTFVEFPERRGNNEPVTERERLGPGSKLPNEGLYSVLKIATCSMLDHDDLH